MDQRMSIGGTCIAPGERTFVRLPIPSFYSHSDIYLPVHVIRGRREGPTLFVSAAIHGDEINGVEIIRRLLKSKQLKLVRGTLIAVPVVNVYGFLSQSRYLPDRRDLNRSFPGFEKGSIAARLAYIFMQEIVHRCTHGIDLHTAAVARENLPQIRAKVVDSPRTRAMALSFGTPVVIHSEHRDGSLREAVKEENLPVLLYEAGEALRFNEIAIRAGVKGVLNVMRHLSMLAARKVRKPSADPLIATASRWERAMRSGILRGASALGAKVMQGDVLGWIADPFGTEEQAVHATVSGVVIGKTNLPLVHEGEAIYHIACFEKPDTAYEAIESFQEEHNPLADSAIADDAPPLV